METRICSHFENIDWQIKQELCQSMFSELLQIWFFKEPGCCQARKMPILCREHKHMQSLGKRQRHGLGIDEHTSANMSVPVHRHT